MLQVLRRIGRLTAPDPAPDPSRRESAAAQDPGRSCAKPLSAVCHALRTPLTSIIGSSAALLDDSRELDRDEVRQFGRIIAEQAKRMDALIRDLLDGRSIEAGPLLVVPDAAPYVLGDLEIHYEERRVSVAGRPVDLTATEYGLLRALSRNAGRVSTYAFLRRQVWGERTSGNPILVRTYIKKLRRKLGDDAARPAYIVSERGVGYRMARPDDA